jgi:hypothetical protein
VKPASDAGTKASPAARAGAADPSCLDEAVLADVTHDLKNQFHRLYYCAEVLRSEGATAGDESPLDLLDRTVRHMDEFLTGALDYFRPLRLETVRMGGADLARALESVLRSSVEGADVEASTAPGVEACAVAIDPGRISAALRAMAGRLAETARAASESFRLEARVGRALHPAGEMLEIRIEVPALGASTEKRGLVDWARAAKVFAAHGGGLERDADQRLGVTLWLPLLDGDKARRI